MGRRLDPDSRQGSELRLGQQTRSLRVARAVLSRAQGKQRAFCFFLDTLLEAMGVFPQRLLELTFYHHCPLPSP